MKGSLVLLLLALALPLPAAGHGSWTHCGALDAEAPGADLDPGYYVVKASGLDDVFLYTEANDVTHLQRGDQAVGGYNDPCQEAQTSALSPDMYVA